MQEARLVSSKVSKAAHNARRTPCKTSKTAVKQPAKHQ
jgi:hypothetical protein